MGDTLNWDEVDSLISSALREDIGSGDITSESVIPVDAVGEFQFTARQKMVLCGLPVVERVLKISEAALDLSLESEDGDSLQAGQAIAVISGNLREILKLERVCLNFLQHLSGIATSTAEFVEKVEGSNAKILDTRKTIPGWRGLAKYAVKCGGGQNHRIGLYDMVLIKDNHISAAGGIAPAIEKARQEGVKVEVECDTLEQVREAIIAKPDIILADNMSLEQLREVVALTNGVCEVEASGNVGLETVKAIAETGVDYISTSKITMSAPAIDIGLDEA